MDAATGTPEIDGGMGAAFSLDLQIIHFSKPYCIMSYQDGDIVV